jgi:hypothetical protein
MVISVKIIGGSLLACAMLYGGALRAASEENEALLGVVTNCEENVSNARCFTVDETKKVIDDVFAKESEFRKNPGRVEAVKRLVDDGMATLVSYEADDEPWKKLPPGQSRKRKTVYKLVLKWMEAGLQDLEEDCGRARIVHRGGAERTATRITVKADGTTEACSGWMSGDNFASVFGEAASLELERGTSTNAEDVVVVADVEMVDLVSLGNLAHARPSQYHEMDDDGSGYEHSVRATYGVQMLVRNVRHGECPFRRFSFHAVLDERNASATGRWLFYRGMTLEVALSRSGDTLKISRIEPVFPYPPYSKEGICLYTEELFLSPFGAGLSLPEDAREAVDWQFGRNTISTSCIAVQYGESELAIFESTTNLIEGLYGIFPDYGPSVRITVCGDDKSNLDYWHHAWFAFDNLSSIEFDKDGCSIEPERKPGVLMRFMRENDGFVRKGGKVSEGPGIPPDLDALTKELESKGFANVAGALYANVYASPASVDLYCTPEQGQMHGKMLNRRQSGNGWIVPPKEGEGSAKFLAYGCFWWEAPVDKTETTETREVSYSKARLARDLVLVREYVDEVVEFDVGLGEDTAADILAFALHARQAGSEMEGERIVASLFARKRNGDTALKALRKRLSEIARDYPDFETWEKKMLEKKTKEKSDGDESDE